MEEEASISFKDLLVRLERQHLTELRLLRQENQLLAQGISKPRSKGPETIEEENCPVAREDAPIQQPLAWARASTSSYQFSCGTEFFQDDGACSFPLEDSQPPVSPELPELLQPVVPETTDKNEVNVCMMTSMSSANDEKALNGLVHLHRFSSTISVLDRAFFETDAYELAMGILILISVAVLALEMQLMGLQIGHDMGYPNITRPPNSWNTALEVLRWTDRTFTGIFVLDILLRLAFLRLRFFCQRLNLLDFVVVFSSLLEELFDDSFPVDAPFLRLLRFAKVARSLRILQRAHILGSLHLLLKSVHASLEVLFWSLCLLAVIQCIAGMLLAQSVQSFLLDESNDAEARQAVFRYFGTFTATLLTMFEVLMANWAPPCRVLVDCVSEWYSFGFIVYRCLVGFAVLNVVSAVFLQQTMKVAAADQEVALHQREMAAEAYTKKLEAFFKKLDKSGDGVLTWKEFGAVLNSPRLQNWLATLELESKDLVNLFNMIDDGDGEISLEDFLHGARHLRGPASSIALAEVMATARRTEAKAEALLMMLPNMSGVGVQDLKKRARRMKSPAAAAGRGGPVPARPHQELGKV